jgi:hypothetical protein
LPPFLSAGVTYRLKAKPCHWVTTRYKTHPPLIVVTGITS